MACTLRMRTISYAIRPFSTSTCLREQRDSWLSKLLVRRIEPSKESHSRMLSDKDVVYAIYTHNIRPDVVKPYLQNYQHLVSLMTSKKELGNNLIGSWTISVGDLDQAIHLWEYNGGFEKIDKARRDLRQDEDFLKLKLEQGKMLRSRHLQYLLAFSYWPKIELRKGNNLYEIRSYALKPGTMIEWGNNWARAISYRKNNNEAFAGFFSQVGRLYNVHHFWCYKDLQCRRETRESAWRSPGWDECVAYTVPLIREMQSRILEPTPFSPTQ